MLPGHERDWSLVQVALTDITARKKAEAYLEYLGTHDVLTKLYNRSFYVDELNRLERKGPYPVTIIMADLNGLKAANDELGHAAGDQLLRRAGEVLNSLIEKPSHAARIGGDEFAILLPETDEVAGEAMIQAIQDLVAINNTFYPDLTLSLSMGSATAHARRAHGECGQACRPRHAGRQAPALHGNAARPPPAGRRARRRSRWRRNPASSPAERALASHALIGGR